MTECLNWSGKVPEDRDRLSILVIAGSRTDMPVWGVTLKLDWDHSICPRKKGELVQLHLERQPWIVRVWLVQHEKGSEKILLHLKEYFVREVVSKGRRHANSMWRCLTREWWRLTSVKKVVDCLPYWSLVAFGRTDQMRVVLLLNTLDCGKVFRLRCLNDGPICKRMCSLVGTFCFAAQWFTSPESRGTLWMR